MLVFMEGEKRESPEKIPRSKDENQQETQTTGTRNQTPATLVEGYCSHHCTIPAPPNVQDVIVMVAQWNKGGNWR